jgi:hypothetical protein
VIFLKVLGVVFLLYGLATAYKVYTAQEVGESGCRWCDAFWMFFGGMVMLAVIIKDGFVQMYKDARDILKS